MSRNKNIRQLLNSTLISNDQYFHSMTKALDQKVNTNDDQESLHIYDFFPFGKQWTNNSICRQVKSELPLNLLPERPALCQSFNVLKSNGLENLGPYAPTILNNILCLFRQDFMNLKLVQLLIG